MKAHLNDCGEEGCEAVARLSHPDLVEGDAAGGRSARVTALLLAVEPENKRNEINKNVLFEGYFYKYLRGCLKSCGHVSMQSRSLACCRCPRSRPRRRGGSGRAGRRSGTWGGATGSAPRPAAGCIFKESLTVVKHKIRKYSDS